MASILGGLLVFAAFVIAGLWATIRAQREQIAERDERIAALVDHVPPHAVQFVVDAHACFGAIDEERATEPGEPPPFDLAAMGNDRQTLA